MNTRLTNTILIVLLLLNLAFFGGWWMHMKSRNRMHRENNFLENMKDKGMMFLTGQLGFDSIQVKKAEKIFHEHSDKMQKYQSEIGRLQKEIFKCMTMDTPDSAHAFMLADSVGAWRIAVQKELFMSSVAIRQICDEGQKKKYDELLQNMTKRLGRQWNSHGSSMRHDSL
ncbi:MAG: periplasmic heavy metal sensor [Bacteroidia bacterium]